MRSSRDDRRDRATHARMTLLLVVTVALLTGAAAGSRTAGESGGIITFDSLGGKPYTVVTDDQHSKLLVNGRPSLFLSGSIHYARSTPAAWDGLLLEAKANGLTMITVYVFWNLHERIRGQYDFETGRRNLPLFLRKAAAHGLFVYLRPGPYVCAEWDYGGLPTWLHNIKGMSFRTATPAWQREALRWLKKVVNVVEPHLAKNGGPIMLGQAENVSPPFAAFRCVATMFSQPFAAFRCVSTIGAVAWAVHGGEPAVELHVVVRRGGVLAGDRAAVDDVQRGQRTNDREYIQREQRRDGLVF